jgi:hypothetical protein
MQYGLIWFGNIKLLENRRTMFGVEGCVEKGDVVGVVEAQASSGSCLACGVMNVTAAAPDA